MTWSQIEKNQINVNGMQSINWINILHITNEKMFNFHLFLVFINNNANDIFLMKNGGAV